MPDTDVKSGGTERVLGSRPVADHNFFANLIWQIADLLRGPYRPPQYERVMLPMTVLRRFDCVLAPSKAKVLAEHERSKDRFKREALDWKKDDLCSATGRMGGTFMKIRIFVGSWSRGRVGRELRLRADGLGSAGPHTNRVHHGRRSMPAHGRGCEPRSWSRWVKYQFD
jgi:hypothetical protein